MSKKIEFLTPGSQWSRKQKNGKESVSTVICVSNQTLKDEVLEKHPQQIVFLTHRKEVLTQTIDTYLANRNYVGQDESMAAFYETWIVGDGPEKVAEVSVDDIDNITLPGEENDKYDDGAEDGAEDADLPEVDSVFAESDDTLEDEATIPVFEPAVFAGIELDSAFVSYTEMPNPQDPGSTMHALRFVLDDQLTLAKLNTIFDQRRVDSLSSIVIDSSAARINLTVTAAWPAFVEIDLTGSAVGIIYLGSQGYIHSEMLAEEQQAAEAKEAAPVTAGNDLTVNLGTAPQGSTDHLQVIPQIQTQPEGGLTVGISG